MSSISLRLSEVELSELSAARGRTRRATYCQDAAVWFAQRVLDYAPGAGEARAGTVLGQLLARLRPVVDRWHRSLGAGFILSFTAQDLALIDAARCDIARSSFAYLAVRCRSRYDLAQTEVTPTLPTLAALVESKEAGDGANHTSPAD